MYVPHIWLRGWPCGSSSEERRSVGESDPVMHEGKISQSLAAYPFSSLYRPYAPLGEGWINSFASGSVFCLIVHCYMLHHIDVRCRFCTLLRSLWLAWCTSTCAVRECLPPCSIIGRPPRPHRPLGAKPQRSIVLVGLRFMRLARRLALPSERPPLGRSVFYRGCAPCVPDALLCGDHSTRVMVTTRLSLSAKVV